jgi:hypothetical protein
LRVGDHAVGMLQGVGEGCDLRSLT